MKKIIIAITLLTFGSIYLHGQSDDCGASATLLTPGVTCTYTAGNTTGFTPSGVGCTNGNPDDDGWFRFVATATSHVVTVQSGGSFDAVLGVYINCSGTVATGGTCVNATGTGGVETRTVTGLTIGNTYYIKVHHFGPGGGIFQICVSEPPTNNECSGAITLTPGVSCSYTAGSTSGATQSLTGCTGNADDDVWYQFTATATSHTVQVQSGSGFDAVFQVYSGVCGGLTSLVCRDATGSGGLETWTLTGLTVGATYRIRVYHYGTGSGSGNFQICVTEPTPPPANNECSGAITLTAGVSCSYTAGSTTGATQSLAGCTGNADDDVWYQFTATATSQTVQVQSGSGFDAVFQVYSGVCGGLTSLVCRDATGSGGLETWTLTGLTVGATYRIRVYHYGTGSGSGNFQICVYDPCGPSPTCNSLMGTGVINVPALPYSSGSGTTCGAGNEITNLNAVTCGSSSYFTGEDQVFVFTPTASGTININLTSSGSWTGLMLYQGCPVGGCGVTPGTCIAYSQSSSGSKTLCANVTAGQTYYLVLDSWASPTCNAYSNLTISAPSPSPSCASLLGTGVINVPALPYSSGAGTTCGAINDLTSTNMVTCGSTSYLTGEDQVFVFTPTSSGCITIDLTSSGSYTGLMLYEGCPVGSCGPGSGICIANAQSSTGSKSMKANVTAGQTYYLVLDSWASPTCNAYSNLSISAPSPGPANDNICSAQALLLGVPVTSTNECAGSAGEPAAPACWTTGAMNTVWFSVTAPLSGQLKIRTLLGTLTGTQIQVFSSSTGNCSGTLTSIGCNQSFTACGNSQNSSELILTGLTPGNTYFIRVDGRNNLVGTFSLIAVDGTQPYPPIYGQDCGAPIAVCGTNMNMGDPGFIGFGLNCDLPYPAGGCPASCLIAGEKNIVYYQFDVNPGTLLFVINPNLSTTDYDWSLYDITGVTNYCTQIANGSLNPIRCSYAAPSGPTGLSLTATDQCEGAGGDRFVQFVNVIGSRTYLLAISNYSGNNTGYSIDFTGTTNLVLSTGTLVWSGSIGTNPTDAANWSGCGVPDCGTDVEIFPGPANQPVLTTGQVLIVRNITINPGAGITIQANADLFICGDFANYGNLTNFNALSETRFVGNAPLQTISGYLTGTYSLGNVRIQKTAPGVVRITDDMECIGVFQIDNSVNNTFNCNNRTLSLRSHFTNVGVNGTFLHGNGTVRFIGTGTQNYTDPGGDLLYKVVVDKPSGNVVMSTGTDVMNIANQLNLTQGHITNDPATQYVFMQNNSLTSIINYNPNSYINGRLRRNISAAGGPYDFPVGSTTGGARAGYHPFTLNFTSTNAASMYGHYIPSASSYTSGSLAECGQSFTCTYGNLGYWRVEDALGTFSGTYNFDATANTPASPSCSGTITVNTVAKAPTGTNSWALEGTDCTNGFYRNALTSFSDFVIIGSDTPFPVEGMELSAHPLQNKILLTWSTNLEVNNKGFEIERSTDGLNFQKIGWKDGSGNSQTIKNYQFEDTKVNYNQKYYYRLKQMDYDGNYRYSNVAEAILNTYETFVISPLYPNPTNGNAYVNVYCAEKQDLSVRVYNSIGQLVLQYTHTLPAGNTQVELATHSLANGIYQVEFNMNGQKQTRKLSITK